MTKINSLLLGDCLSILPTLPEVDLVITDPPYGVLNRKVIGKGSINIMKRGYGNHCDWDYFETMDDFRSFTQQWFKLTFDKLKQDTFMFIFWSQKLLHTGFEIFDNQEKPIRLIIWRYNNLTLGGNGDFAYDYEPIFVIKKGNPKLPKGKHSCDLEFTKPQSNFTQDKLIHPTQKPIKLIQHLIELGSKPNDLVLDPFGGSGTTGAAAKELNRNYILIEKSEEYYNMSKNRLNNILLTY